MLFHKDLANFRFQWCIQRGWQKHRNGFAAAILLLLVLLLLEMALKDCEDTTQTHRGLCQRVCACGVGVAILLLRHCISFVCIALETLQPVTFPNTADTHWYILTWDLTSSPWASKGRQTRYILCICRPHWKSAVTGLEWASGQFITGVRNTRKQMKTQLSTFN